MSDEYTDEEVQRAAAAEREEEQKAVLDYRLRRMMALHIEVERRDRQIAELQHEAKGESP